MISARFYSAVLGVAVLAFGCSFSALPQSVPSNDLAQADKWLRDGQSERALEGVDRYLAAHPKDARGRFMKGVILAERKKPQEAMKIYTDLTHDYPDLPEPYNNLAVLHAAQGDYDQARAALEMAIRVKPDYAVAYENLGDIYANMAARAYNKTAQLDRGNKTAPVKLKQVTELLSAARR
jgi:Flp pilus assembly protein TadD